MYVKRTQSSRFVSIFPRQFGMIEDLSLILPCGGYLQGHIAVLSIGLAILWNGRFIAFEQQLILFHSSSVARKLFVLDISYKWIKQDS